mmetsp:Transcript_40930/g.46501  ORF Transcript_40930/g.46501 Transcript_40930/m.46501 type:complete len:306 (+) Transcript_40930:24-941(+)
MSSFSTPDGCITSLVHLEGTDYTTTKLFKNALLQHYKSNKIRTEQEQNNTEVLELENKYFMARIRLVIDGEKEEADDFSSSINDNKCKEDGKILVFPSTTTTTSVFDGNDHKDNVDHNESLLLKLCIICSFRKSESNTLVNEDEYSKRILWCLDRGYEYCEVDLSDTTSGFDDREKEGFARVIEAIEGTVWSSAIMTKKKKLTTSSSQTATPSTPSIPTENTSYKPPSLLKQEEDEKSISAEERDFNEMENLIKEATKIRSMSQNSEFQSDEERRQRAANAATLMMQFMKLDDESDNDDDSSSSQ